MLVPFVKPIDTINLKGKFIVSYPNISDNRFFKSIIYITNHTKEGAEGVVINKSSAYTFVSLVNSINNLNLDKKNISEDVKKLQILRGGPINSDKIFILHSNDYSNVYTNKISEDIYFSTNIDIIEKIIELKGPKQVSIFIGNCTWTAEQLEREIKNDTWLLYQASRDFIFNTEIDQLWKSAYENLGINNTSYSYFSFGEKITQ